MPSVLIRIDCICRLQIEDEIAGIFDLMQSIYGLFEFTFELELSTRPENFLGEIETWNSAEKVESIHSELISNVSLPTPKTRL